MLRYIYQRLRSFVIVAFLIRYKTTHSLLIQAETKLDNMSMIKSFGTLAFPVGHIVARSGCAEIKIATIRLHKFSNGIIRSLGHNIYALYRVHRHL